MDLPVTDVEVARNMAAGLQLLKVVELKDWKDKDGNIKRDKAGWPGIEIVMQNALGETISFTNYYCTAPLNDPIRKDAEKRCKSEFYLARFKAAFGFDTAAVSADSLIGKMVYAPVAEKHMMLADGVTPALNDNGQPLVFTELVKEFYSAKKDAEGNRNPPDLPGDPAKNNGVCGGIFRTIGKSTKTPGAKPPAASPAAAPKTAAQAEADGDDF